MSSANKWQPDSYDQKLKYVSEYGKDVVSLLNPQPGETILDLGCGTGDLSYEIHKYGATVTGMDSSPEMINTAKKKYPQLQFNTGDGENFSFSTPFDAVFSNAAFHWMTQAPQVIHCIHQSLQQGGRFVAEFGGKGNVQTIIAAINDVLLEGYGIDTKERNPWYFPSIGEYSQLLENKGFHVMAAHHFERPTELQDGEQGLIAWLDQFSGNYFLGFNEAEKQSIYSRIITKVKPFLFHQETFYADYKRLRIVAVKL